MLKFQFRFPRAVYRDASFHEEASSWRRLKRMKQRRKYQVLRPDELPRSAGARVGGIFVRLYRLYVCSTFHHCALLATRGKENILPKEYSFENLGHIYSYNNCKWYLTWWAHTLAKSPVTAGLQVLSTSRSTRDVSPPALRHWWRWSTTSTTIGMENALED